MFRFTPYADELTLAAAAALMDAESIDKDRSTDLLAISFAATDYVGHACGLDSLEAEDNLFRLDNTMANLPTLVEDRVLAYTRGSDHRSRDILCSRISRLTR